MEEYGNNGYGVRSANEFEGGGMVAEERCRHHAPMVWMVHEGL